MTPERILQLADAVRLAHDGERARARRKLAKLDAKVSAGHEHLRPLRDKIAAAAGER